MRAKVLTGEKLTAKFQRLQWVMSCRITDVLQHKPVNKYIETMWLLVWFSEWLDLSGYFWCQRCSAFLKVDAFSYRAVCRSRANLGPYLPQGSWRMLRWNGSWFCIWALIHSPVPQRNFYFSLFFSVYHPGCFILWNEYIFIYHGNMKICLCCLSALLKEICALFWFLWFSC